MNRKIACFAAVAILLALAGVSLVHGKRRPLPRPSVEKKIIEPLATGYTVWVNPETGQSEEYPLEGQITVDARSGRLLLSWNGTDGKRKTLIWETPWDVDAVIAADVEHFREAGIYGYKYSIQSLPTSLKKLQSLYIEVRAAVDKVGAPDRTWYSRPFTEFLNQRLGVTGGRAWSQTDDGLLGLLPGGKATGFSYTSDSLPGMVKCWVRAHTRGHFAGEEAPDVLVDAIVKYNWMVPQGFTVGPDERLAKMGLKGRLDYLIAHLPQMLELGWIENDKVMQWYKENLLAGKIAEVRAHAKSDFDNKLITSEVLALMTYLTK